MFIRKLLFATVIAALAVMGGTLSTTARPATAAGPCDYGTATYNQLCTQFNTQGTVTCSVGTQALNQLLCPAGTVNTQTTTTTQPATTVQTTAGAQVITNNGITLSAPPTAVGCGGASRITA